MNNTDLQEYNEYLMEKAPPLTEEEVERYIQLKMNGTAEQKEAASLQLFYYLRPVVGWVISQMPHLRPENREDDIANGEMGLIDAIIRHDPKEGGNIKTYATSIIRYAISDNAYTRNVSIPRRQRKSIQAYNEAYRHLRLSPGIPTDEEIAEKMGEGIDKVKAIRGYARVNISLDYQTQDSSSLHEMIAVKEEEQIADTETIEELKRFLSLLNKNEKYVILRRYFSDTAKTLKDIAEELELTESRICQIEKSALKKLREAFTGEAKETDKKKIVLEPEAPKILIPSAVDILSILPMLGEKKDLLPRLNSRMAGWVQPLLNGQGSNSVKQLARQVKMKPSRLKRRMANLYNILFVSSDLSREMKKLEKLRKAVAYFKDNPENINILHEDFKAYILHEMEYDFSLSRKELVTHLNLENSGGKRRLARIQSSVLDRYLDFADPKRMFPKGLENDSVKVRRLLDFAKNTPEADRFLSIPQKKMLKKLLESDNINKILKGPKKNEAILVLKILYHYAEQVILPEEPKIARLINDIERNAAFLGVLKPVQIECLSYIMSRKDEGISKVISSYVKETSNQKTYVIEILEDAYKIVYEDEGSLLPQSQARRDFLKAVRFFAANKDRINKVFQEGYCRSYLWFIFENKGDYTDDGVRQKLGTTDKQNISTLRNKIIRQYKAQEQSTARPVGLSEKRISNQNKTEVFMAAVKDGEIPFEIFPKEQEDLLKYLSQTPEPLKDLALENASRMQGRPVKQVKRMLVTAGDFFLPTHNGVITSTQAYVREIWLEVCQYAKRTPEFLNKLTEEERKYLAVYDDGNMNKTMEEIKKICGQDWVIFYRHRKSIIGKYDAEIKKENPWAHEKYCTPRLQTAKDKRRS